MVGRASSHILRAWNKALVMSYKRTVVIADEQPIFLLGLRNVLEGDGGYKVVGHAADGFEALRIAVRERPDFIIMDVRLGRINGFEVAAELRKQKVPTKTVFLTAHKDDAIFGRAVDMEIPCYLLKQKPTAEVLEALKALADGREFASGEFTSYLMKRAHTKENDILSQLGETELKILACVAEHKTSKQIAGQVFLSYKTIENYRTRLRAKLGLKGKHALIKFAVENRPRLKIGAEGANTRISDR